MSNNQFSTSRYEKRDKKRKTNIVLNTLIGIVLVLIFVIGSQLILGANQSEKTAKYNEQPDIKLASDEESTKEPAAETEENEEAEVEDPDASEEQGEEGSEETENTENNDTAEEESTEDPFEQATITEGEPGSGVAETIENPAWEPVGTSQSEPHSAQYDKNSQDWKEMTKALGYATGIPESEMIIWHLGNNGSPNDAVGTISPKDQSAKYKVYITWVENKGWMPTKIEKQS
ncbi:YrrS family protein [Metabacillus halosaccharovorans]|uniref:YrrS family protein n=1 Tax=Metabacillus halosaccharovorans TaxID=930124 RepID=UPI0009957BB8|nr:YrrS family protein [Metabacillus halosaccharovorans]